MRPLPWLALLVAAACAFTHGLAQPVVPGETRGPYSETYLVDGWGNVKAFSWATPYLEPGPCLAVSRYSNMSLSLDSRSTGCNSLLGHCRVGLVVTVPAICSIPAPYPTVMMFAGYHVKARYYKSIVDRLASWGYSVLQYERNGATVPPNEVEAAYVAPILAWAARANATARHPLSGALDTSSLVMLGHSMGGSLASVAAAQLARQTKTMVLLDPVDYTQLSLRVARKFVQEYGKEIAVVQVGVHCSDRTGCMAPLDHSPTAEDVQRATALGCKPDWWCCDYDDRKPGMEEKTILSDITDGADGYIEFAAPGSVVVTLRNAGHMSFMDWDPRSDPGFLINCPWTLPPAQILPDALPLIVGWVERKMRGVDLTPLIDWATTASARQRMQVSFKGLAVAF